MLHSSFLASVVQWIEHTPPKGKMQVRFLPGAPDDLTSIASLVSWGAIARRIATMYQERWYNLNNQIPTTVPSSLLSSRGWVTIARWWIYRKVGRS